MDAELVGVVWGVMGMIIVALIGLVARSGKPHHNPTDPDQTKMADMSVTYWKEEFRTVVQKLDEIIVLLHDRLPRGD